MTGQPTPRHTYLLWTLMFSTLGESFAAGVKPALKKPERDALVLLGWIEEKIEHSEKKTKKGKEKIESVKKASFRITIDGWEWASRNLDAALPTRGNAQFLSIVRPVFKRLMQESPGKSLADIFGARPLTISQRIRDAYLKVTGGKYNESAPLHKLRPLLSDVDRPSLDAALLSLLSDDDIRLVPIDNRVEITEADRKAAILVGDDPRHFLRIVG